MNDIKTSIKKRLYLLAMCATLGVSNVSAATISDKEVKAENVFDSNFEIGSNLNLNVNNLYGKTNKVTNVKKDTKYKYKKANVSKYKGKSIVDLLNSLGLPTDAKFRGKLATLYKVVNKPSDYKKTSKQNIKLVKEIKSRGMILIIDKKTKVVVGCQNKTTKEKLVFAKVGSIENKVKPHHKHDWQGTGEYISNSNGTHKEVLKCNDCGKTKDSKDEKCDRNFKMDNDYLVVYCGKCDYEFNRIHICKYTELVSSTYVGDDKHLSTYRCPICGKTTTKEEVCRKETKEENNYKTIYCLDCKHEFSRTLIENNNNNNNNNYIPSYPSYPSYPDEPTKPVEPEKPSHTCDFSEYVESNYSDNHKHLSTYRCPTCGKTTQKEEECEDIIIDENDPSRTYCDDCHTEYVNDKKVEHKDHIATDSKGNKITSYYYNEYLTDTHFKFDNCLICGEPIESTKEKQDCNYDKDSEICIYCDHKLDMDNHNHKVPQDENGKENVSYISNRDGTHCRQYDCPVCNKEVKDEPEKCDFTKISYYNDLDSEHCYDITYDCPECGYNETKTVDHDMDYTKHTPSLDEDYPYRVDCLDDNCTYYQLLDEDELNNLINKQEQQSTLLGAKREDLVYRKSLLDLMRFYNAKYSFEEIKKLSLSRK